jgi:hypothetical protein
MLVKVTEKGKNKEQPKTADFGDIFSCLSDEEQQTFGEYLDRIIDALHANARTDDDEMFERMEALRTRFGDIGAFFEAHGFSRCRGIDPRLGFGREQFGRGGFPGSRGFHKHDHACHRDDSANT